MELLARLKISGGRSIFHWMSRAREPSDLLGDAVATVLRACDIVLGTLSVTLALYGTLLLLKGESRVPTVLALWTVPIFNGVWSAVSARHDRVRCDLFRAAVCLPFTAFLYVSEPGILADLWIPALIMPVGINISLGVCTRKATLGHLVTAAYAASLVLVARANQGAWLFPPISHAAGILASGSLIAVVSGKIGALVDEARLQRDGAQRQQARAEAAIGDLTIAMEQRLRMEIELRQAQKLESVGRLAAGVAHEINTPVQFVSDSINFLRDASKDVMSLVDKLQVVRRAVSHSAPSDFEACAAEAAEEEADLPYLIENMPLAFERSLEGLDRVANIVRAMKDFAHPDAIEMTPTDLNHAIESTLIIAHAEYKYVADLDKQLGELPPVMCHAGEINQAVLNLVVNAAHAIGDVVRGRDDKGRISVTTRVDGADVIVEIGDTGGGIPLAIRDRIFDPFYTTKEVGRGTGQGLAIARSVVVDKHGGELSFESTIGVGTTFRIRLPIGGAVVLASAA